MTPTAIPSMSRVLSFRLSDGIPGFSVLPGGKFDTRVTVYRILTIKIQLGGSVSRRGHDEVQMAIHHSGASHSMYTHDNHHLRVAFIFPSFIDYTVITHAAEMSTLDTASI